MPKHALSFKHLVGTSAYTQQMDGRQERTVNELLSAARQTQPLEQQPVHVPHALPGPDGASIHPAELLRREQLAHQQAARSVAGPAPPRSWRRKEEDQSQSQIPSPPTELPQQSPHELEAAAAFLGNPQLPVSLLDTCARLVLRLLRSTTVVDDDEGGSIPLADAVLAGACQLDGHLKGLLISTASALGCRLSDRQIRALLEYAEHGDDGTLEATDSEGMDGVDWDTDAVEPLAHLALALHPNPLPLIRDAPSARLLALTSLDLAYATVPDFQRFVAVLPAGLRSLGLAGVRGGGGQVTWLHGLTAMSRKLTLLRTLDLSNISFDMTTCVTVLFQETVTTHLPSLRTLGLRGYPRPNQMHISSRVNRGRSRINPGSAGKYIDIRF